MTKIKNVDYSKCASMELTCLSEDAPDMVVLVYGLESSDLRAVPGGNEPGFRALDRLGLNPRAYTSSIFNIKDVKLIKRSTK